MMLHKIFHMNQTVDEAQRRLWNVGSYRHHLEGVERANVVEEKVTHCTFQLPLGFNADFMLHHMAGEGNSVMFRSVDGDLTICGVMTFTKIKRNLTEVDITVNYESNSFLFNALDRVFRIGDHFLVNQLRRVRAHFEGIAAPVPHSLEYFHPALKTAAM